MVPLLLWGKFKCPEGNEIKGDEDLAEGEFSKKEKQSEKKEGYYSDPGVIWAQDDDIVLIEKRWSDSVVCGLDSESLATLTSVLDVRCDWLKMAEVVPFL